MQFVTGSEPSVADTPGRLQHRAALYAVRPHAVRIARRKAPRNAGQGFRGAHGRGLQAPRPGDQIWLHPWSGRRRRLVLRVPEVVSWLGAGGPPGLLWQRLARGESDGRPYYADLP